MRHTDRLTRCAHLARSTAAGRAAVAALALVGLAACDTGGATDTASAPATVTVTRTTSAPAATGEPGTTSATSPPTSGATATTPAGGVSAPAGAEQSASGLPTCQPSQMSIRIEDGGAAAGHVGLRLLASNTGRTQCVTQGYPGVSFVAPGTGKQIGAPADRDPVVPAPLMRLEPGKTAVALVLVAQAGNYGPTCDLTRAAGFRVYLPGTTTAAYVPHAVDACAAASVHQLSVQAFTS